MGKRFPKRETVTMKHVAEAAGVSIATVSRVLNGSRPVDPKLESTVLQAAKTLDFRPNAAARFMRGQRTGTIGLVVPDLSHPFFSAIATGAISEARQNDLVLIVSSTEGSRDTEKTVIDQLARTVIDGLIFCPVSTGDPLPEEEKFHDLPVVVVGRRGVFPDRPHVYTDNIQGGYLATRYLLTLGREKIAFLAGFWDPPCQAYAIPEFAASPQAGTYSSLDRFTGYMQALSETGIPFDPGLLVISGYDFEAGYKAARELVGRLNPFDAILAANDLVAAGALRFLAEQRIRVPTDVSVIGYDDGLIAPLTHPTLTSVHQEGLRLGVESVQVLDRILAGEPQDDRVIGVKLTVRNSTSLKERAAFCSL